MFQSNYKVSKKIASINFVVDFKQLRPEKKRAPLPVIVTRTKWMSD